MTHPPTTPWTFTDRDADQLSWHDVRLYGVTLLPDAGELAVDLDWPVQRVAPADGERYFRAWTSPATLVFHGVTGLQGSLEFPHDATILALGLDPDQADELGGDVFPASGTWWFIKGVVGHCRIRALGFTQYLRAAPILVTGAILGLARRGGVSFDRRTPADAVP